MIHEGNLDIKAGDKTDYSKLTKVTGNLYIKSNADLKAPQLKSVGGELYINSNADLKALKSVGGDLSINSNADLKALKSVGGDLYIKSNADLKAPQLKSVGGYLSINSNADLKALKSVGGYLYINSNADLKALKSVGGDLSINSNADLKALKSVGGDLYINSNADLKALKSVGGYLYINSNADLKAPQLKSVGGYLYINSNADLKALKSVGGDLYINSKISIDVAKNLWGANRKDTKKKWYISNLAPEWLIERVAIKKNTEYVINNVTFNLEWFNKIRKDQLTADEVFAIDNVEHRRVAYEIMDKTKMSNLKDFKVLDEKIDNHGLKMRIVSFNIQNMKEDLLFYNCFCPSTKREYYLGTSEKTCDEAKAKQFGYKANEINFVKEW